jgi:hypothetical protein
MSETEPGAPIIEGEYNGYKFSIQQNKDRTWVIKTEKPLADDSFRFINRAIREDGKPDWRLGGIDYTTSESELLGAGGTVRFHSDYERMLVEKQHPVETFNGNIYKYGKELPPQDPNPTF